MPMTRILTFSLSLYWAIFFACHSVSMLAGFGQGGAIAPGVFSSGFPGLSDALSTRPFFMLALSAAFALTAALFLWSALSALLLSGKSERQFHDIPRHAFASAGVTVTAAFIVAATHPAAALFQSISLVVAGLAGSYAAIASEGLARTGESPEAEENTGSRMMALDAAHTSLLERVAGLPAKPGRGDV